MKASWYGIDRSAGAANPSWAYWIGHIGFFIYFLLTFFFYEERLLNNDAGYYSFHVINNEDYFVKHNRYISYFVQWLPIALAKADCSLKTVLQSYSYIFGIWFYLLWLFNAYILKNPKGGIYVLIALIGFMRYKFYAGHTEITFAIAVASTLIVWITTDKSGWKRWHPVLEVLGTAVFCAWLYIIHPVIVVPLLMVLGYHTLMQRKWLDPWLLLSLTIIAFTFILRFTTVMQDGYESEKVGLMGTLLDVIKDSKKYYVFIILKKYLFYFLNISILLYLVSLVILFLKKKYLEWLYFIGCSIALLALVIASHAYLRGDIYIMIDGYIAMFGMLGGILFFRAVTLLDRQNWLPYVLGAVLTVSFIKIYDIHNFYERRLNWYKQLVTEQAAQGHTKLFVPLDRFDWNRIWYPYEVPFESLVTTTLDPDIPDGTIFIDDANKGAEEVLKKDYDLLAFYHSMHRNPRFFKQDTSTYKVVRDVPWKRDE